MIETFFMIIMTITLGVLAFTFLLMSIMVLAQVIHYFKNPGTEDSMDFDQGRQ